MASDPLERLRKWHASLPERWLCNKCGYYGSMGPEHRRGTP